MDRRFIFLAVPKAGDTDDSQAKRKQFRIGGHWPEETIGQLIALGAIKFLPQPFPKANSTTLPLIMWYWKGFRIKKALLLKVAEK